MKKKIRPIKNTAGFNSVKKIITVITILLVPILIFFFRWQPLRVSSTAQQDAIPIISGDPKNTTEIILGENSYQVSWIKVEEIDKISLTANFTEKETARNFYSEHKCKFLTSAGFYTKDNQPLGLFITGGKVIREKVVNNLIPEIFYLTEDYQYDISESLPNGRIKYAIQLGPLLINNRQPRKLAIRSDEPARRIILAIGTKREIYLSAVYDKEENFQGPTLTDLPKVLMEFQKKAKINLQTAVNLDGGSASAFIKDDLSLEELTSVGSFFCITD
ncbi:phosphodiester glycosidase family protein [Candidatus Microgenomates bacterium]|nr:phosphodiester glycosidase family protein [Candidatus Microgenomates bacterium]